MNYTIEENHQFVAFWNFPVIEGLSIDEENSIFILKKDGIEHINVNSFDRILEIRRNSADSIDIIVRISSEYLKLDATYEYQFFIMNKENIELFSDQGTIFVTKQKTDPLDLDIQTNSVPWDRSVFDAVPASEEVISERLSICKDCPFYQDDVCMQCGCYMPQKVTILSSVCPVGHW